MRVVRLPGRRKTIPGGSRKVADGTGKEMAPMALTINHNLMAQNVARNLSDHYGSLSTSTQRLSSGLRINSSADDAAGLAVRELMRSDISTLNQGIRNANDAISMIQTADGALQIIDEKLVRMKELAEQAATGTYSSDQRIIINSEFQAMALEIERISKSTDFNGIKLLDGSLAGTHDGSGLNSTGAAKIHFGTGNDSAEDYYYVNIANAGLEGLTLGTTMPSTIERINERVENGVWATGMTSGVIPYAYIPKGAKNVTIQLDSHGGHIPVLSWNDDIAIFTRDGAHLAGYPVGNDPATTNPNSNDYVWSANGINLSNVNSAFITESNGFLPGATYDSSHINTGGTYSPDSGTATTTFNGMTISSGGDGNWNDSVHNNNEVDPGYGVDYVHIDEVTEDLLLFSVGSATFAMNVSWDSMTDVNYSTVNGMQIVDIQTQDGAQKALTQVDQAMLYKDNIRAGLGATQNRLENTISNLQIQSENLQAAESQISDTDVAQEMTSFVREQILTQAATAMLTQANSMPKMALQLITG